MVDNLPNVFQRLQAREDREDARRQAVWNQIIVAVLMLIAAAAVVLTGHAVVLLVRTKPWSNGLWLEPLRHDPLPVVAGWLGWVGWFVFLMSSHPHIFFRIRDNAASRSDVAFIISSLSCWILAFLLEHRFAWAAGLIPAYLILSWFVARVWPGPPRKPGSLVNR